MNKEIETVEEIEPAVPDEKTSQPRWKSWAVWVSIFGLISVIFTALNIWEKIGITSETFEIIVSAIGTILTAFGIVNNPTDGGSF